MKNPGALQLATLKNVDFYKMVAHTTIGLTGTWMLSEMAFQKVGFLRRLSYGGGYGAVAGRAAVRIGIAGALSAVASRPALRSSKLVGPQGWKHVPLGGAMYTIGSLLGETIGLAIFPSSRRAAPLPPAGDMGDWMELSGMGGGMGAVYSASDLVAGESAAQPFQLGGMGSSGGNPIPLEDLRGYPGQYGGGMGDWVELGQSSAVLRDAVGSPGESF